jgi:hypothetical protein
MASLITFFGIWAIPNADPIDKAAIGSFTSMSTNQPVKSIAMEHEDSSTPGKHERTLAENRAEVAP